MKAMTVMAAAVLAAGIHHYRRYRSHARAALRPDDAVAGRVRAAVGRVPVEVRVARGVVTLRGSVTGAERDRALAAAMSVPGVTQVSNQLEVLGEAPAMERGAMRSGMTQPPEPGDAKRSDPDLEARPGFTGGQ